LQPASDSELRTKSVSTVTVFNPVMHMHNPGSAPNEFPFVLTSGLNNVHTLD